MKALNVIVFISTLLSSACSSISANADVFHLVKNENTFCKVVVSPSAPQPERFAAQELQRYIQQMTKINIPIITNEKPVQSNSILIGQAADAFLTSEELAKVCNAENDGYLLTVKDDKLLIRGNRPGITLFGVYQLLRKFGCQWISPLPWGELIPEKKELSVSSSLNEFREAELAMRGLFITSWGITGGDFKTRTITSIDWMAKHGVSHIIWSPDKRTGLKSYLTISSQQEFKEAMVNRGLLLTTSTHSWPYLLPQKLYEEHPEYRAVLLSKDADRRNNTFKPCTSHPGVIESMVENIKKLIRQVPELKIISLGSSDGRGWCECERCKFQDDPKDPKNMARRRQIFVNKVVEQVCQEFPNTKFKIEGSYGGVNGPARDIEIPESVYIITAHMHGGCYRHFADWRDCKNKGHRDRTKTVLDWAKAADGRVLFHGYCVKTGMLGTWWPICKAVKKQFQWMKSENLLGMESQFAGTSWWSMGLNSYNFLRLSWDSDASVEDIIKEYCIACFGEEAGASMAQYYLVLENAMETYYLDPMNYRNGISVMLFWDDNGILESMNRYLRQAEEKATADVVMERLKNVRTHYEYSLQFKRVFICDIEDVPDEARKLRDILGTLKNKDIAVYYKGVLGHLSKEGGGTDYTGLGKRYKEWLKTQGTKVQQDKAPQGQI